MFAIRRAAFAAPRQVSRRAWQPIVRSYADDAAAGKPATNSNISTSTVDATSEVSNTDTVTSSDQTSDQNSTPATAPDSGNNGSHSSNHSHRSRPPPRGRPTPTSMSGAPPKPVTLSSSKPFPSRLAASPKDTADRSPDVDWTTTYYGISSRPVTEKQFNVLMKPLDENDIEVKPDGIIYLPEIKYRRRLNEAFGPMGWGLIPRGEAQVGQSIVTREYALIVDGRFVSQAQGENTYFNAEQLPSAVEGCKSNALMRCCKDLGIASELWDPTFIRKFKKTKMQEVWVEHMTTKKKRVLWFKAGQVDVVYPYKRT